MSRYPCPVRPLHLCDAATHDGHCTAERCPLISCQTCLHNQSRCLACYTTAYELMKSGISVRCDGYQKGRPG